jgi:hypothetical protein
MPRYHDLLEQLHYANIPPPIAEFRFAPPRKFRADFAWPDHHLLLEIEGGVWTRGRHTRASGFLKDIEKYNLATARGYRLVRVTPQMIQTGDALSAIEAVLCPPLEADSPPGPPASPARRVGPAQQS